MRHWRLLVAGLLVLGAAAAVLLPRMQPPDARETVSASAIDLTTSESCRACHEEVYREWEQSYHALSYVDPLVLAKEQSNNFRNVACISCHAPAPILEYPIGKGARVFERFTHREQGVDCLACHKMHGNVAGRTTLPADVAPCAPVDDARISSAALCAPCHNQHDTVNEWEASEFHERGVTCLDCHMAPAERTLADGTRKQGRSHVFPGGHDPALLKAALDVQVEVRPGEGEDRLLVVTLTNTGAGHNYPSDARHRALDLVVTLIQPDGIEVPAREPREPGREPGTARRRFRNPYRQDPERLLNAEKWGRENTQIRSMESQSLEVPYSPERVSRARIEVIYKLTPLFSDTEGTLVHEREVEL